jgi:hypothetical protein
MVFYVGCGSVPSPPLVNPVASWTLIMSQPTAGERPLSATVVIA